MLKVFLRMCKYFLILFFKMEDFPSDNTAKVFICRIKMWMDSVLKQYKTVQFGE